jgi:hypothetical protein
MALWEDHLLPMLTRKDAARLGCTCKALRGVAREHFKDVGTIKSQNLKRALTTFPRARTVTLHDPHGPCPSVVEWLCEGLGRYLERVTSEASFGAATELIHRGLRQGALPSLKRIEASLDHPSQRASLSEGLVAGMQELRLAIFCGYVPGSVKSELAALGLVRQLPALAKLQVFVHGPANLRLQWPPFVPHSLKALRIDLGDRISSVNEPLLCALPGMLGASGARLERLEVYVTPDARDGGDALVHLAQALRICSPTLKGFLLGTWIGVLIVPEEAQDYANEVERLRVQWADVLAGVCACRELQVLTLPQIEVGPLFPPGTAFYRLTQLEISDHERVHPPDPGVMGLWELMASGGLPALTSSACVSRASGVGRRRSRPLWRRRSRPWPAPSRTSASRRLITVSGWATSGTWGTSGGWRWASCGGSRTSPLTCPKTAGSITRWPRAWPPVLRTALSPYCGGWKCSRLFEAMPT